MQRIVYILTLIIIYPLSFLPVTALYGIANFLFFLVYHVFRYRRNVVRINLGNSFPEKKATEIHKIEKEFYSHFCDMVVEWIRMLNMPPEEVLKRCHFINKEHVEELYGKNKSFFAAVGHYGNWEWAGLAAALETPHTVESVYKPLFNKYFDDLMHRMRGRFGMKLIPEKKILRRLLSEKGELTATVFLSDQTPVDIKNCYWMDFLTQDTPVFNGIEKLARKLDRPVVFVDLKKTGRGYYEFDLKKVTDDPRSEPEGSITKKFMRLLEARIRKDPSYWLWSHRRWKRVREYG